MANKKQGNKKGGMNTMAVMVTGAVIGAGIAVAGAAAMKEENRQKMKIALSNAKGQAEGYIEQLQKQAKDRKELRSA